VARQGAGLGHTAGVGITGRAEAGVRDIVAGTVGRAPGVFVAHVGEWWAGEVILSIRGSVGEEIMNQLDVRIRGQECREEGDVFGAYSEQIRRWNHQHERLIFWYGCGNSVEGILGVREIEVLVMSSCSSLCV